MEVVINQEGAETMIRIIGRLDTNTTPNCEEKVMPVWEKDEINVTIDCSELEYVSSSGLRLFLVLQKSTNAKKGNFRLINMQKDVYDTFCLTGFNSILKIEGVK